MVENFCSQALCENLNQLRLKVLSLGSAVVDDSWKGRVLKPTCSRLYFILSGSFTVNGQQIHAGNCLLLPAGHGFTYGCAESMEQVYIHLQLVGADAIDLLSACPAPMVCPFLPETGKTMRCLVTGEGVTDSILAQKIILETLHSLLTDYGITLRQRAYSPQICRALEYIANHLSVQLSLSDISEYAFLAASTLTRKFRRETGMSVGQYVDAMIMFRAEQMLKSGDMSVREISEALGFCDQFYFARRFKEKFGIPPSAYRKLPLI